MKKLQPHQQRVVDEESALHEKTDALNAFITTSPIYDGLDNAEQNLLCAQMAAMTAYLGILRVRIDAF
ncbi:hypothetical protein UJ11_003568 [Salmonella enterica subsp. enterica]|nr:hypothetical protein [Salmonella enterica subsp. enterica serovar Baguida]